MSVTICPRCRTDLDPTDDSIYCEECGHNITREYVEIKQYKKGDEIHFDIQAWDPDAETAVITLLPYVQATVREVFEDDEIAPDYWLQVNCIETGTEYDIRASYVESGL